LQHFNSDEKVNFFPSRTGLFLPKYMSGKPKVPDSMAHNTDRIVLSLEHQCCRSGSVIRCLFDPPPLNPGYGMGKKSISGSGIRILVYNPDHVSESLETIFWVKILKFFYADPGWK
jgi:hypothetical protein